MELKFTKMQGIGNDFVVLDMRSKFTEIDKKTVKKLCDRKFGIGCDQLILLESIKGADCKMIIYNQDGSKAGACGNATRCVSKIIGKKYSKIRIGDRTIETTYFSDSKISVNMGKPIAEPTKLKFKDVEGYFVDIGNTHLIFFVEDFNFDISDVGPHFERHKKFPNSVNVNFAKIVSDSKIELKVWERGAGETLGCGSGACATQYTANFYELTKSKAKVSQQGEDLTIEIKDCDIIMTGPAVEVFDGKIAI